MFTAFCLTVSNSPLQLQLVCILRMFYTTVPTYKSHFSCYAIVCFNLCVLLNFHLLQGYVYRYLHCFCSAPLTVCHFIYSCCESHSIYIYLYIHTYENMHMWLKYLCSPGFWQFNATWGWIERTIALVATSCPSHSLCCAAPTFDFVDSCARFFY